MKTTKYVVCTRYEPLSFLSNDGLESDSLSDALFFDQTTDAMEEVEVLHEQEEERLFCVRWVRMELGEEIPQ